jgi:hypothetical protein
LQGSKIRRNKAGILNILKRSLRDYLTEECILSEGANQVNIDFELFLLDEEEESGCKTFIRLANYAAHLLLELTCHVTQYVAKSRDITTRQRHSG